jgi:hypothetical protein
MTPISYNLYSPDAYDMLKSWWAGWDKPAPPIDLLPQCGIIGSSDTLGALCYCALYQDNTTPVAEVGWVLSNPFANALAVGHALHGLPGAVEKVCAALGRTACIFRTGLPSLKRRLSDQHWDSQHDVVEFWKSIKPEDKN